MTFDFADTGGLEDGADEPWKAPPGDHRRWSLLSARGSFYGPSCLETGHHAFNYCCFCCSWRGLTTPQQYVCARLMMSLTAHYRSFRTTPPPPPFRSGVERKCGTAFALRLRCVQMGVQCRMELRSLC